MHSVLGWHRLSFVDVLSVLISLDLEVWLALMLYMGRGGGGGGGEWVVKKTEFYK
jgi:hypothetical protein